jgi:uncharacterized protein (DUF433 family)
MSTQLDPADSTSFVDTPHIVTTPGICGGKPRIEGTSVRVQDVVLLSKLQKLSPQEIMFGYPQVTLAQVHAALAYYHDHAEAINKQIQEDDQTIQAIRDQQGSDSISNQLDKKNNP